MNMDLKFHEHFRIWIPVKHLHNGIFTTIMKYIGTDGEKSSCNNLKTLQRTKFTLKDWSRHFRR